MQAGGKKTSRRERLHTVVLTDRAESHSCLSKAACLSFLETGTCGRLQSDAAWPPSDVQQRARRGRGETTGMQCGKGPLAFLLSAWHWQLTPTRCPRWAGDKRRKQKPPRGLAVVCFRAVLGFLCGCSREDSKYHSSVTHVDSSDPAAPKSSHHYII